MFLSTQLLRSHVSGTSDYAADSYKIDVSRTLSSGCIELGHTLCGIADTLRHASNCITDAFAKSANGVTYGYVRVILRYS